MAGFMDSILQKQIDLSKYPDPHTYSRSLERALWVMEVVQKELGIDRLKPSHIAKILTEKIGIAASPQAINIALERAKKGLVHRSRDGFKLMEKGRAELFALSADKQAVVVVEPGKPFTSKTFLLQNVLSQLKGEIKICDPYCGPGTLDILSQLDKKKRIFLLTQTIVDKPQGNFERVFRDFKAERPNVAIRVYDKSVLHDRYIIAERDMWLIGQGLKDLGKKESFLVRMGDDIKESMAAVFDRRWKIASPIS